MQFTEQHKQAMIVGGVLGGVILVILIYMGFMFINPAIDDAYAQAETQKTEYEENNERLQTFKKYLEDEQSRQQVEAQFNRVKSRLPGVADPIEVFDLLRDYIEGTGVFFSFLDAGNPVGRERYSEFPFTLRGTARYHEFGQLINLVECNPQRLMRVSEFRLTNNDDRPSIHPMELKIQAFTFNE